MEQLMQWNNLFQTFKGLLLGACSVQCTERQRDSCSLVNHMLLDPSVGHMCGCKMGNFQF